MGGNGAVAGGGEGEGGGGEGDGGGGDGDGGGGDGEGGGGLGGVDGGGEGGVEGGVIPTYWWTASRFWRAASLSAARATSMASIFSCMAAISPVHPQVGDDAAPTKSACVEMGDGGVSRVWPGLAARG